MSVQIWISFVCYSIQWLPTIIGCWNEEATELGHRWKKKLAEVLTETDEDLLWSKGLLGGETPKMLLDTVVFYNGLHFALRSGREHRQLRHSPCQVEVVEKPVEWPYHEETSKTHPGGLKGRKTTPKVVVHYSNTENPERCFVTLFKKYRQSMPMDKLSERSCCWLVYTNRCQLVYGMAAGKMSWPLDRLGTTACIS